MLWVHSTSAVLALPWTYAPACRNVALSPSDSYAGGGTWFEHSGETLVCERGGALLHAGGLPHCGVPVTRGVRHLLVLFLLAAPLPLLAGRLQAIGAAAGTKPQFFIQPRRRPADLALSSAALQLAIEANPRDAESHSQLGHNFASEDRHADAQRCFEAAVELSRGRDFAALVSLAEAQAAQRQHAAALVSLQAALELAPPPGPSAADERRAVRRREGLALVELERYEEAGLLFDALIDEEPGGMEDVEAWASLGVCMAALRQPEAALSCQKQVQRIRAASASVP
mmetsp:Transcript_17158/g.56308  ORF Transcript_17158/g.56308 Transcript_17158/m.56308 type:complete len:285 (+) Transcript_17158:794-1648(+)